VFAPTTTTATTGVSTTTLSRNHVSVDGGDDLTFQGGHWSAHDLLCAFESIDENIEAYLLTGGSRGSRDDA
jgi:hypothetical protein